MNHNLNKAQALKRIILQNMEKIIPNSKPKKFPKIKIFTISQLSILILITITFSFLACSKCLNNEISLKLVGKGNQTFINNNFIKYIKTLEINNVIQNITDNIFDFTLKENTIKISFKEKLTNCKQMFYALKAITEIDLSEFDFSSVKYMTSMFQNCSSLNKLIFKENNMNNVNTMNKLFLGCIKLKSLNLSNLKTNNVQNMVSMFEDCHSLRSINLENFNAVKVNSMTSLFNNCTSLISLNIKNFKAFNLKNMTKMFYLNKKITVLDLSSLDTSQVTLMNYVFCGCYQLKSIDLSSWNTANVTNMLHLFHNCRQLISINISHFVTSKVTTMNIMFNGCRSLTSLNLSNFNTSLVTNMNQMFYDCRKLTELNLSNFNTTSLKNSGDMFGNCLNLKTLNLSNFDTSLITIMDAMFYNCKNLTSLDISSFNTSLCKSMNNMFKNCSNLEFLDLSSFDTYNVVNMSNMFSNCEKLIYLNISNFDTSSVTQINSMFSNCSSLEVLNLYNFKYNKNISYLNIFEGINPNVKSCINDETTRAVLGTNDNINLECNSDCFNNDYLKLILFKNDFNCLLECSYDKKYKFEYNNNCYEICPNNTHVSYHNEFLCEDDYKCPEFDYNITECELKVKDGFYLDKNDGIYKRCYYSCKSCDYSGNEIFNNCTECKEEFIYRDFDYYINKGKYINCRKDCPYKMFYHENNYICTEIDSCTENYSKLINGTNLCIDDCQKDDLYKIEYNNTCFLNNLAVKDKKISSFFEDIVNHKYDDVISNITQNKKDFVQQENDMIFQITTSENQKNNNNSNISTIDLGDCEDRLKDIYHINKSLPLIIFKIDYNSPDTLIPIIGYEIYHPISYIRLNLSYCEDILIKLNIPVSINENNLYKYDPNSGYYTDNCFAYTTEDGTDIILNDRKQEFSDNNLSLCENNCNYNGYDMNSKKSTCECAIKNKMELISEIMDNPNKLSNEFDNEESSSSSSSTIITMKCTKTLFTKEGLKSNISSYILLIIIFFFLLSIVLFIKCGYILLSKSIAHLINERRKQQKDINKHNKIKSFKQNKGKKKKKSNYTQGNIVFN